MKKHPRFGLIVMVTVILLLALTAPGLAKNPDNSFVLEFDMNVVDWDNFTFTGTFTSTGAIEDEGDAYGHWIPVWGNVKGTMILQSSDDENRIVISYIVPPLAPCTLGHFRIDPKVSTGMYEGIWGQGEIEICRDYGDDTTYGSLVGFVIYP